jgi:hypothetical protein
MTAENGERADYRPPRGYSWAPFEDGNEAGVRHGAFSERKVRPLAEAFAAALSELVPLGNPSDSPAVSLLATVFARLELASRWLDEQENSLVDGDGHPWPVLRHVARWERQAGLLCAQLGLTLAARAEIGLNLAGAGALAKRANLSALSLEELAQLRRLTSKARAAALGPGPSTEEAAGDAT